MARRSGYAFMRRKPKATHLFLKLNTARCGQTTPNGGQVMKRASYRVGVQWIADNDETFDRGQTVEDISGYISTLLLADLFGVEPARVAADVVRIRAKQDKAAKR